MIVRICYCCVTVFMFIDDITADVGTSVRDNLYCFFFYICLQSPRCVGINYTTANVGTHVRDSLELLFLYSPENIY